MKLEENQRRLILKNYGRNLIAWSFDDIEWHLCNGIDKFYILKIFEHKPKGKYEGVLEETDDLPRLKFLRKIEDLDE